MAVRNGVFVRGGGGGCCVVEAADVRVGVNPTYGWPARGRGNGDVTRLRVVWRDWAGGFRQRPARWVNLLNLNDFSCAQSMHNRCTVRAYADGAVGALTLVGESGGAAVEGQPWRSEMACSCGAAADVASLRWRARESGQAPTYGCANQLREARVGRDVEVWSCSMLKRDW